MRQFGFILLAVLFLTACVPVANPKSDSNFTQVDMRTLSPDLKQWAESHKSTHHAAEKIFSGKRYILASYGEKPTGGYTIIIEDVVFSQDKITITINHTNPAPGTHVTQALTYPQDMIWIDNLDLPVEYVATGAQSHIGKDE